MSDLRLGLQSEIQSFETLAVGFILLTRIYPSQIWANGSFECPGYKRGPRPLLAGWHLPHSQKHSQTHSSTPLLQVWFPTPILGGFVRRLRRKSLSFIFISRALDSFSSPVLVVFVTLGDSSPRRLGVTRRAPKLVVETRVVCIAPPFVELWFSGF